MLDTLASLSSTFEYEEVVRVLTEISKMEQRYNAVVAVIRDGLSVSKAASKYGISRQSLYRWMARYETAVLTGVDDHSRYFE